MRDGDEWVVNGQKVWTSGAQFANGVLVARTDVDVPKHAGISYFLIDMDQPGVEVRPLREMTGERSSTRCSSPTPACPPTISIGGEGNGWAVANTTLAFERSPPSAGGGATTTARPGRSPAISTFPPATSSSPPARTHRRSRAAG